MTHIPYDEYKYSGLGWLPHIPKEWQVVDFRRGIDFLTDFEANGSFADVKTNVELDTDEKYAWYLRATDLQNGRLGISDDVRTCDQKAYDYLFKTKLFGGEFLVAKRGEIGKIYVVPDLPCKATLAPNLYLIRLNEKLNTKFTYYWYTSSYGKPELMLANKSTTIGALYKDDVRACKILFPSVKEQHQIANFLDHETAKIDTLIDKQQQLIKLLKEKRQAVISHAVTKGLNPDAPMKDSGVEWLGEVPEHWNVSSLKHFWNILDCKHITAEFVDEGIPLASIREVKSWHVDLTSAKRTTDSYYDLLIEGSRQPKAGDIIYSRNVTVGEAALVPPNIKFAMGQDVCLMSKISEFNSEFLLHQLKSPVVKLQLESLLIGSTFKRINVEEIRNFLICVPPTTEQHQISLHLQEKISRHDALIGKSEKAIELMRERRTALISAAVTGKIDVRNWKPELQQASMEATA